jgi:DNA-binding CsgD family transcriptional regulator
VVRPGPRLDEDVEAVAAARRSLLRQLNAPHAAGTFGDVVMSSVEKAVGCDGYCLFGVDPISNLRSVMFSRSGLTASTERLVHNETVERDANRYEDLITRSGHVGTLSAGTTAGATSTRLNEMLRPEGYGSELRLALVSDGRYWGALSMFREGTRHPFTEREATLVADLAGPLTLALRRYQVGTPARTRTCRAPGVLLFHRDSRAVTISRQAQLWLQDLAASGGSSGPNEEDLLRVTYEVASATTQHAVSPTCRGRVPDGSWLVVSGGRISHDDLEVAVILTSGDPLSIAPAFSVWCGLTPRQSQILNLLVSGFARKQIGRQLNLSSLTVDDHVKVLYQKAGVSGREELLSLLS